jgi:hypothetical protein
VTRILSIIPAKPSLHPELCKAFWRNAHAMTTASLEWCDFAVMVDSTKVPSEPGDFRPWSKVARIRNRILDSLNLSQWDYFLWIDADVIRWPAHLPKLLMDANSTGVTMPMVFVDTAAHPEKKEWPPRFYDTSACVMKGCDGIEPTNRKNIRGRNVEHLPTYWFDRQGRGIVHREDVVEMDCVGTVTLVNADIYRSGARYEDHPAFTDHYPICKKARDMGRRVCIVQSVVAWHAELPDFGEEWH